MGKIVYYVATTLDGYICAKDDGIDCFSLDEELVQHYQNALKQFDCTIMGRATYEFGYRYGLEAGKRAYPHMEHYIFSKTIDLPENSEVVAVRSNWKEKLVDLKATTSTDIYLCGGSEFAGFVLEEGLIDELILKVNPFCLGEGKPLFASNLQLKLKMLESKTFDCGVIESRYRIEHGASKA